MPQRPLALVKRGVESKETRTGQQASKHFLLHSERGLRCGYTGILKSSVHACRYMHLYYVRVLEFWVSVMLSLWYVLAHPFTGG